MAQPETTPKQETTRTPKAGILTLVMIHGAGQSAGLWHATTGALKNAATVALDLPGHGLNHGIAGEISIAAYAEWVVTAIGDRIPGPVVLCGHSMGGAVVQHLLLHQPRSFAAGILVNTGARLRVRPEYLDLIRQDYDQFVDLIFRQCIAPVNQTPILSERFRQISVCDPQVAFNDYSACNTFDLMDRIGRIRVPVLVIGSDQDNLTPVKYSTYLAENIPGAFLNMLPSCGHYGPLENPPAFNGLVADFLESL